MALRSETKISKVWHGEAIYGQTLPIISKTKNVTLKETSVFECSHIVLHQKTYELKFDFAQWNEN